ncbi:hypothetical protein Skr01_72030 [Sphaerisporangium krabiense]|uniref:CU044_5270 family protein n=1 Tax=Sphaerisporangium krabiense TaxID=763782 RepID=A0A7W9DRB6_9ACTN|nr:CU044_5270 family protein [Sphaerisporangium krabiense]MBB5628477.1 hypothetical protein [Sphaerisporangium krabiense]GII67118.1 hypothetical protein Skr01_72030 [Sphaerisporangium krabiense]
MGVGLREFRRDTPEMTAEAEGAARARLVAAMRAEREGREGGEKGALGGLERGGRGGRVGRKAGLGRGGGSSVVRLGVRVAVAAGVAVLVGAGIVLVRGGPAMVPAANVRELGERAAEAAESTPAPVAGTGKWLYIKQLQAPAAEGSHGFGRDLGKRMTWEQWTSSDGKQVAWYQPDGKLLVQGTSPGVSAAELSERPVTPEEMIKRVESALQASRVGAIVDVDHGPPTTEEEELFQAISQLMSEQSLGPEVRAALFRALPTIPGVSMTRDVADADGRKGVAFSYAGSWARSDLILDATDYRFLGTYGVTLKDQTFEYADVGKVFVKAGTPLNWTAQLETQVVDRAGLKP